MLQKIRAIFIDKYHEEPVMFRSPGRVNILGEHTDYNEGYVLPAAINKSIFIAVSKRTDHLIKLYAVDFEEDHEADMNDIKPSSIQWANYILGVVDQLQKAGFSFTGFNLVLDGDIPIGAGLSSSAAVECATIFALNEIYSLKLEKIKMVPMAQRAEHVFVGVRVGIMDQFASMFGKKDHVIKLDCRSLDYEYVPFQLGDHKILLLNTNVKHNLASSEYNNRRIQCEKGVSMVAVHEPSVKSLRDADITMLKNYVEPADPLVYSRCKYVVEENERLLAGCEDLKRGDIKALGEKMFRTHRGLRNEYEVSCKELDFLVDYVQKIPAVAGARMMGGGFGGCTINLVPENEIEKLVHDISLAYQSAMNLPLTSYIATIENGTEEMFI
ncbi:MAG: galactokinase [Ferruginibacter sp.]